MILGQDVLRWVTVQALRGRTWVGPRVFDSPSQPADLKISTEREPFVAVYTDDADVDLSETQGIGQGLTTCILVIEVAAASEAVIQPTTGDQDPSDADQDEAPQPQAVTTLAPTDEALEFMIGAISLQVKLALEATDNPWADLWRRLVARRDKIEVRRGGPQSDDKAPAIRFASRVNRLHVLIRMDPLAGQPLPGIWRDIFDAMETVEGLSAIAELLRPHYEGAVLPDWRIAQKAMGVSTDVVRALGIETPLVTDEANSPPYEQVGLADGPLPDAPVWMTVRPEED